MPLTTMLLSTFAAVLAVDAGCGASKRIVLPDQIDSEEELEALATNYEDYVRDQSLLLQCLRQFAKDNHADLTADELAALRVEYDDAREDLDDGREAWNALVLSLREPE